MKRTLYVSDLDGTLLRKNQKLSPYAVEKLNEIIEGGVMFSYATARSIITASQTVGGLLPQIPVIVYNGAFILQDGKILHSCLLGEDNAKRIFAEMRKRDVLPIVYAYIDGKEQFSYCETGHATGATEFLETRKGDIRERMTTEDRMLDGDVFYFTCIDEKEKLTPLYEMFKNEFHCIFGADIYSGEYWLEILSKEATKANAVQKLKKLMDCDELVVFGDGRNDVSMFSVADKSYAVANAEAQLKRIATAVIESNEEDGVVKWLETHAMKEKENNKSKKI